MVETLTADLKNKEVPESDNGGLFVAELLRNYRQNTTHGKKLYIYFATRILASVNAEITNFKSKKMKTLISDCFTVTDEAFALLILLNSESVWRNQVKEPDKTKWNSEEKFQFRFTKKNGGKRTNSWSNEGLKRFRQLCKTVKKARTGEKNWSVL
jgi:hypothetical protein